MSDARSVIIKAASIANDYIQGLGDQSRPSEILGRGVQRAILDSSDLAEAVKLYDAALRAERDRLREALEEIILIHAIPPVEGCTCDSCQAGRVARAALKGEA